MRFKPDSFGELIEPGENQDHRPSRIIMSVWMAFQAASLITDAVETSLQASAFLVPAAGFTMVVSESLWRPRPLAFHGGILVGIAVSVYGAYTQLTAGTGLIEVLVGGSIILYVWMTREVLLESMQ